MIHSVPWFQVAGVSSLVRDMGSHERILGYCCNWISFGRTRPALLRYCFKQCSGSSAYLIKLLKLSVTTSINIPSVHVAFEIDLKHSSRFNIFSSYSFFVLF
jgi:hypothetical protein